MSDYNFEQLTPEIFCTLEDAQRAMAENPLPLKTMQYEIRNSIGGGLIVSTYEVGTVKPWRGVLNTNVKIGHDNLAGLQGLKD